MGWDEQRQTTVVQRVKESADDYRYFPEPDLPVLEISREWVEEVRATLPELPDAKRDRFMSAIRPEPLRCVGAGGGSGRRRLFRGGGGGGRRSQAGRQLHYRRSVPPDEREGRERDAIGAIKLTPKALAGLVTLVQNGTINHGVAKQLLVTLYAEGGDPAALVEAKGWRRSATKVVLIDAINAVLDEHPDEVARYLAGEEKVIKFLMGMVMRSLKGRGDAQAVQRLLAEQLETRR